MVQSNRLALVVLAFTAVAAAAVYAIHPDDAEITEIKDIWAAEEAEMARPIEDPPAFDATNAGMEAARKRSAEKHQLVEGLIAGRRSLVEVAARFHALDVDRPNYEARVRSYGGATLGEQCCRAVIAFTDAAIIKDPRRGRILACLNAELNQMIAEGGQIPNGGGTD
jgi:hypothetical protein